MAENKKVESHPAWEDWLGFALGIIIVMTPMLSGEQVDSSIQVATAAIGLLIVAASFFERMQILEGAEEPSREWEEVLEAMLGGTLIALPFIYGYADSGTLRYWHFALGGLVLLLAVVELRRDYVADMARIARRNPYIGRAPAE